ncbi:Conserved putative membrane protein [Amycolatopsis japonica]|uniref:Conserved putative membrane protein n=1 Tax=Amycolatopsis japonica TaxID=208439 RepID=A0A075V7J2_9PSEU|nr:Conserved putative membrane protein [Amycolatopsis japonica]
MSVEHDHSHHEHQHHGEHGGHGGHGGHGDHGGHEHHQPAKASWGMAASATLHCLTGCAIGEVLGMVIGTALGWGNVATIVLAVALAFVFGYALTMRGVLRAGVGFKQALKIALAADTVSILVMEIVDNGVMIAVPGAMDAGLGSWLFWGALAFALLVAFVLTTPVNKWLIGRGSGHAVVHAYHH